jgi:glycosyltransferase involved in cell wall biosynthesis
LVLFFKKELLSFAMSDLRVAVLIPCRDEAPTIGKVVADFRARIPGAMVYVYDNNSNDQTIALARAAGAIVRRETLQGKGHVIRRMFADVEAGIYVLVDGDDTYDAAAAPRMVGLLLEDGLDMVTATRQTDQQAAYRPGHRAGNLILTGMVRWVFGDRTSDMLSGYRVFSRRFVKSFPAIASGFETETEFTVHALELNMPIGEIVAAYSERPPGSASKLNTVRDGVRILRTIVSLIKEERPLPFFGGVGALMLVIALALGIPVIIEFYHTGLVRRFPTAILATGLVLLSSLSLFSGLILESVSRGRHEAKRLAYLAIPGTACLPKAREAEQTFRIA